MKNSVTEWTLQWLEKNKILFECLDQTGSTNDWAKSKAETDPANLKVYLTSDQTHGHGRGDRKWLNTAPGTCLLSTWSLPLKESPGHLTGPLIGLALYKAVKKVWPEKKWSIKPPNDLYLDDKKLAGLLTAAVSSGKIHRLCVGIGFNVLDHPQEIEHAGHLTAKVDEKGLKFSWSEFLTELCEKLISAAEGCSREELSDHQRSELLPALNALPLLKSPYLDVLPSGDLSSANGIIKWTEL